jgi:hypothetical protein
VLLPERVTRVLVERSLAPFDAEGLGWYEGMTEGNIREFRTAERGEGALRPVVEREASAILEQLAGSSIELLGDSYELAEADTSALSDEAGPANCERRSARRCGRAWTAGWTTTWRS